MPVAKREYGYFVLPILHGDRLIGRIDPVFDRAAGRLVVKAVYAEPDAPDDTAEAVATAIADLAAWIGAREVTFGKRIPSRWRRALMLT